MHGWIYLPKQGKELGGNLAVRSSAVTHGLEVKHSVSLSALYHISQTLRRHFRYYFDKIKLLI